MLNKSSKIFLVADDSFCRQLMEPAIQGLSFQNIYTFDNGASCLAALTGEPNITFLNQMMDSVSGTDALKAIKCFVTC